MTATDHHLHPHDRAEHWRRIAAHLRDPALLRARLDQLPVPVEALPRILANFKTLTT